MPSSLKNLCIDNIIQQKSDYSANRLPPELKADIGDRKIIKNLENLSVTELCGMGQRNKNIALIILKTPKLYEKLGSYDPTKLFEDASPLVHSSGNFFKSKELMTGNYFLELGTTHKEVAQYILSTPKLKEKLSATQIETLKSFSKDLRVSSSSLSYGCRGNTD
jgi:hypothetical protein